MWRHTEVELQLCSADQENLPKQHFYFLYFKRLIYLTSTAALDSPVILTCMSLGTARSCRLHTERPREGSAFLLWGDVANGCTEDLDSISLIFNDKLFQRL